MNWHGKIKKGVAEGPPPHLFEIALWHLGLAPSRSMFGPAPPKWPAHAFTATVARCPVLLSRGPTQLTFSTSRLARTGC